MNKSLNKYSKARWNKIRLSKRHKARIALRNIRAASAVAIALAEIKQISSSFEKIGKSAAISNAIISGFSNVNKILKGSKK